MGLNLAEELQQDVTDYQIDNEHDADDVADLLEGASLSVQMAPI